MGRSSLGGVVIVGALLVLLGLAGIAVPYFTTQHTQSVANIGPLHVDATHEQGHSIPPLLSEGALALGLIMVAGGLMRGRA